MKFDKDTGSPQFTAKDLSPCGVQSETDNHVFKVTVDDLNLLLRIFARKITKMQKMRNFSPVVRTEKPQDKT